jgi:hypothetical protein
MHLVVYLYEDYHNARSLEHSVHSVLLLRIIENFVLWYTGLLTGPFRYYVLRSFLIF